MSLTKIGASIVLEGEKSYRQALKAIGTEQKELRSEMQLTSATYKDNQNSIDALQSKYEILSKQIDSQKNKVEVYNTALEKAKDKQTESAEEVEKYSNELESARAELEKMKNSEDATSESISEQEKVIASLEGKLQTSQQEYDKNTSAVQNWQTGLNIAQTNLVNLENELQNTEKYLNEAKESTDQTAKSIDKYGNEVKNAEDKTLTFGEVMKANLASDVVMEGLEKIVDLTMKAGEGIFNMAVSASKFADDTQTLSVQTGVAVDTIQALVYSEELLDVSVNTVTSSMAKNIRSMQSAKDGSKNYADAYSKLGIQITDANGNLRDSEEVFWEIVDALGQLQNATERDAISMQLFGRNAQALNPLIKAGSDGFNKLKQEAIDLGYVLDEDTQNSLLETSDSMERVKKSTEALKNQIGAELSGSVTEFSEKMLTVFKDNEKTIINFADKVIPAIADALGFIVDNLDKILPLVTGVGAGFVAFEVSSKATAFLSTAMQVLKGATIEEAEAQGILNTVMNANPVVLLTTAIVGLGTAMASAIAFAKPMQNAYTELLDSVSADSASIQDNINKREESKNKMEASRIVTEKLKNELIDLTKKTSLTAEEQKRMNQVVSELNNAIPDLNLYIDEQTGKLSQNSDELEKNIEDWQNYYDLQFAQNDLVQSMNDLYIAERDLSQVESDLAEVRDKIIEKSNLASDSVFAEGESLTELRLSEAALLAQQEELNSQIEELNRNYDDDNAKVQELSETYENFGSATEESLENTSIALVEYHNHLITISGEQADALKELRAAYEEARESAKESINSQIGLFEELSNKSDLSVEQMKSNLDSQTEVINTYRDDILKATELVEKGLMDEGLLGKIQEMGISGAGYLHELVTASEEDLGKFQEVMDAFSDQQKAVDDLANAMAEIQTNFEDTSEGILNTATETKEVIDEGIETAAIEYPENFVSIIEDIGNAISSQVKSITDSTDKVVETVIKTSKDKLGIDENGNSLQGQQIGTSYVDSMANAIESGQDILVNAVDRATQAALDRASERIAEINRMLGEAIG